MVVKSKSIFINEVIFELNSVKLFTRVCKSFESMFIFFNKLIISCSCIGSFCFFSSFDDSFVLAVVEIGSSFCSILYLNDTYYLKNIF